MQNKTNVIALKYSEKIEGLRFNFLKVFNLSETHLLSFQPNQWFIDRLVLNFLEGGEEIKSLKIYTNEKEEIFRTLGLFSDDFSPSVFKLKDLFSLDKNQISSVSLIWVTDREECEWKKLGEKLEELKGVEVFYSFCSFSEEPFNLNSRIDLTLFSFISYDPATYFEEFGTVFFAFKKNLDLKPVYSGSVAWSLLNTQRKTLPHSLEFGTQNLVSLLVLATAFQELV